MNRKDFLSLSGLGLAGLAMPRAFGTEPAPAAVAPVAPVLTGNGEFVFEAVHAWGEALPAGEKIGPTHGGIARDKAGSIYVNTDGPSGTLVYAPDGKFLRAIAREFSGIHSLQIVEEKGSEVIYASWLVGNAVLKLNLDGTLIHKLEAPAAAGYKNGRAWKPTATVSGPDGTVYVCDGYGTSQIHMFSPEFEYKKTFCGRGRGDGQSSTCHGLTLDTRGKQPLLMVVDRENLRLSHYDLEGKFVANTTLHMRRPCQISFLGELAAVSEINGRVTILDKDNAPVAFLGDNRDKSQWNNYGLPKAKQRDGIFGATHGVFWDTDGSLYVSEWSKGGRICKLALTKA